MFRNASNKELYFLLFIMTYSISVKKNPLFVCSIFQKRSWTTGIGHLPIIQNIFCVSQDDFTSEDFAHMSAPLLFQMFKSKTGFPLHAAVRLQREDVVFLYLVENNADVSINGFILFLLLACNKWFSEQ